MLLLTSQAVTSALEYIHFQLHLRVFFLGILHFVAVQVKGVLNLLCANVILFQLTSLDLQLTLRRLKFFSLLCDVRLVLRLCSLKQSDFVRTLLQSLIEHLDILLGIVQVLKNALVAGF